MLGRRPAIGAITPRQLTRLGARWHQLDTPFTLNDYHGADRGSCVLIEEGGRPLVFSAPHAVHHSRAGTHKSNDAGTGGLARVLAKHLDASVVALRRGGLDFGDPNHDHDHPLKDEAARLVGPGVVLVDLHGMADRSEDVIIGLGQAPTPASIALAEHFVAAVAAAGVRATIADAMTGFNARGQTTMTTWAQQRGADALQFEIARNLRREATPVERRTALLRAFVTVFDAGPLAG